MAEPGCCCGLLRWAVPRCAWRSAVSPASRRPGRSPVASASICGRGGKTKSLRSGALPLLISLIPSRR
jgi:hypothetical protein